MADPHAATRELLEERPAVGSALESVLAADDSGPWEFDDVDGRVYDRRARCDLRQHGR
ncbi:hypothetical protein [Halorubrum halodurans]|uniref:hypothetical protein n=1 Tax=Halorubrum halodurans TaxID=1383851 RepID=UPI0015C59B41|nr:hypothetical protein [Halorubrum halodurans]